jgi:Domain of unknown function (DUF4145)
MSSRLTSTSNPDTPPDSWDPTGICPRCGRVSNFRNLGSVPVTFDLKLGAEGRNGSWEPLVLEQVSSLQCYGCSQAVVVVEEEWVGEYPARQRAGGGTITFRGIHWWPAPGAVNLDGSIPEAVAECFSEGVRCLSAHAPRAAAVMFRRTLEAVVRTSGSATAVTTLEVRNLAAALGVMAAEHTLDPSLAQWAKELRLVGNVGGHLDPLDNVEMSEAEEMNRLARGLFTYLYEMPAKLARSRAAASAAQP